MTPGYDGVIYVLMFAFIILMRDVFEVLRWIRKK